MNGLRRLLRENGPLVPMCAAPAHGPKARERTITTQRSDEMWGSDMTTTVRPAQGNAAVFVAVDHASAECVGIDAANSGNRFEALEPIRQGIRARGGACTAQVAAGFSVRHDHGSAYLSEGFPNERRCLGAKRSSAFVREVGGNGCAERFMRALKENLLWVRSCSTVEELRPALPAFKDLYNRTWLIERHGFLPPSEARPSLGQAAA